MKKFRFFLYFFLFVAIIVLAYLYIVPSGKIKYSYDFSKKNYFSKGFFYKFGPEERIIDKNKLIGDPVYFYLRTPRNFSKANLKIEYKPSPGLESEFLNIQAGVLVDKDSWNYRLKPFYNSHLNNIANTWDLEFKDGFIFAQKEKSYESYVEFLEKDNFSSSAFYNFTPLYNYRLESYRKASSSLFVENIRGSYSFYVYLKEEDLKIDFSFKDFSNLDIFVYHQDYLLSSYNIKEKEFSLKLADLPEGVYKIEVRGGDNLFTKRMLSSLSKLVFINKIHLEGDVEIFSNKNYFRVKALESNCLGDVYLNEIPFSVNKIYQQFNFEIDNNALNRIKYNSCGFLIENSGLFSLSEESFFDPEIKKVDQDFNWDKFDYVLAKYDQVKKEGDYYYSEIELDLNNAYRDKDSYSFIISAPFLKELNLNKYIEIKRISVELEGTSLKSKLLKR